MGAGFELGRLYNRFGGALNWFGVAAGIVVLLLVAASVVFARRRLERWALGDLPVED
jgi:hypothetical protein